MQYHNNDGYQAPWGDQRAAFYGFRFIPATFFDAAIGDEDAQEYAVYLGNYTSRHAAPTDVTLTLDVVRQDATLSVTAQIGLESAGASKIVRVYIVQALDRWPADVAYSRNGFKQAAATEDVALVPGQYQAVQRAFVLDADSLAAPDDVRVIAWAQDLQATYPSQAYQAAVWPPPDCNGNGVPDAQDIAAGVSTDLNHDGIPDECEDLGDLNCDGFVNFNDINPFVTALVSRDTYEVDYPNCVWLHGDCNGDDYVNFNDINPFVMLLVHR